MRILVSAHTSIQDCFWLSPEMQLYRPVLATGMACFLCVYNQSAPLIMSA